MAAVTAQLADVRGEKAPAELYDHRKARAEQRRKAEGKGTT